MFSACKSNIDPDSEKGKELINEFIYDGMSTYYFWADEMKSMKPSSEDPMLYFDKLLNSTDKEHGWSFITDDADALIAEFNGTPLDFGFDLAFGYLNEERRALFGVIRYVYPESPAERAGLKRCDIIVELNGQELTVANYHALVENKPISIKYHHHTNSSELFSAELTPESIETDPVLFDTVYTFAGKKIGYLFYAGFIANYNKSLYRVFSEFKSAGISDLVLDLRYNRGGDVSAALYLASMIAPENVVRNKQVFTRLKFNDYLNSYYAGSSDYKLGDYEKGFENPINANLNLNKDYIIATDNSYSASELTIYCLKPYMDVVHVGDTTGGKYTASFSVHAYDENIGAPVYNANALSSSEKKLLRNWLVQPIVARYTNKDNQDFSSPGYLVPDHSLEEGFRSVSRWQPLGDTNDVFLGQALYLITGNSDFMPNEPARIKGSFSHSGQIIDLPQKKNAWKNSLIIDRKPEALK
jgi:C-terminal processing protease CtpA/Prc